MSSRSRWGWAFVVVLMLIPFPLLVRGLVGSLSRLPHDLAASHGQGVRGTYVATFASCGRTNKTRTCTNSGTFTADDGSDRREGVSMVDGTDHVRVGQAIPALHVTGENAVVYAASGSMVWRGTIGGLVTVGLGVLLYVFLAVAGTWSAVLVRRRKRSAAAVPASESIE